ARAAYTFPACGQPLDRELELFGVARDGAGRPRRARGSSLRARSRDDASPSLRRYADTSRAGLPARGGPMKARSWIRVALGAALACGLVLGSAVSAKDETVLRVGAAASLREVAEKMGTRFGEIAPGTRVELSFGASSELAAQLRAGAPMDVLM